LPASCSHSPTAALEIFVGALIVLVGAPCGFFGATSMLGRICWPAITLAGGISMIANARRDAKHELAEKAANARTISPIATDAGRTEPRRRASLLISLAAAEYSKVR
jgi:hypothetical protein